MLTSIPGHQLVISALFCVLCFYSTVIVEGLRVPNRYDVEDCKNELRSGLQTLQDMSVRVADHEFERRDELKKELEEKARNIEFKPPNKFDGDDDPCQCDHVFTSFLQYSSEENDPVLNFYREWAKEDHLFLQLLLTHFPSSETLCSLLFPSCHSELIGVPLPENVTDKYNSSQCFTCQFCMTGTTLLEHKFLLVPEVYELVFQIFNATLIPNFCTELCLAYPPCDSSSPFALPYKQCLSKTEETYHTGIKMLQKAMIPKQFCTKLQIFGQKYQFCEDPSPTPNILHCLKDYCQDIEARYSALRLVCDLIPDHPEEADRYLNIKRPTKSANSFERQNSRTEL
ncbi:hypothetical protein M3Y94_00633800 [Aphelenchoides besseyi]|nr:hypothetical protein M3Y94_00633800 [Aphelenchoides besseyi]